MMANKTMLLRVTTVLLVLFCSLMAGYWQEATAAPLAAREDYFVSGDTVLIGCTAGAAAGLLAGSLPVFAALTVGAGLPAAVSMMINLTGLGCGVGAASGGVAILTAWMLDRSRTPAATAR